MSGSKGGAQVVASKAPEMVPRGVQLMNILTEGRNPGLRPTRAELEAWVKAVPQPFTAALDSAPPQRGMEDYFGHQPNGSYLLIDLRTMRLIEQVDETPGVVLDDVAILLGP